MIIDMKKSKIWFFPQNNSGGRWQGPAEAVFIEADTCEQANDRAEETGIYFDGCAREIDCGCCRDRWTRVSHYDEPLEVHKLDFLNYTQVLGTHFYRNTGLLFFDGKKILVEESEAKILDDYKFSV